MECTRSAGVEVTFDKCIVKMEWISYFGNLYTPEAANKLKWPFTVRPH